MLKSMRERREEGFTLIELLIVIIILGILAAVVVFAVRGITDRGTASACKSDFKTLQTAAEAFYANQQPAAYAGTEQDLVDGGFLASTSSKFNYAAGSQGYTITVEDTACTTDNTGVTLPFTSPDYAA